MKIWMLEHGGEGMMTQLAFFSEDRPPSKDRIIEFFRETYSGDYGDDGKRLDLFVNGIMENSTYTCRSGYESASLTLVEVE